MKWGVPEKKKHRSDGNSNGHTNRKVSWKCSESYERESGGTKV